MSPVLKAKAEWLSGCRMVPSVLTVHPGDRVFDRVLWLPNPASRDSTVPPITSPGKDQNSKYGFYRMCIAFTASESQNMERTIIRKDTRTPMFIAALFTIAKTCKPPKCPSTKEWIKQAWYIYNGILLSHKNE